MAELDRAAARLRAAVELLALPGDEALKRSGLGRPDALAIEFDEAYTVYVAGLDSLPSEDLLDALQRLDQQLQAMSDPALQEKWSAAAMKADADWETLRVRARAALQALDGVAR